MGFLTSLFGGGEDGVSMWGVAFALIIVLVLIVAGLWLLKLLFKASGSVTRGRQRRLAIIDTLNVDSKRSLLLIRRDDVEHLLVIGGAQDVVVESGIAQPQETPARPAPARPSNRQAAPVAVDAGEAKERGRTAAASRLGLTGLLRRYNDPEPEQEPSVDTPEVSPLERLKNLGQPQPDRSNTSLRHTGLLRSAGNDETDEAMQSTVEEPQNPVTVRSDSAMNGSDPSGAGATASTNHEAAADNAESDDADEFTAQSADVTVDADEFAPAVSVDGERKSSGQSEFDSSLDEDATEPASPRRTQH